MAKRKANPPTWFCFNCQEITPKRMAYKHGEKIVCTKADCVAAVILSETWKNLPKPVVPEVPEICPTCKGEWPMSKKLQKKLPSTPKSREQLLHEQQFSGTEYDPSYIESLSSKIIRGAEKLPEGAVIAKNMTFETLYLNYEGTRRVMKLVSLRKDDVEIVFYSGDQKEWLACTVKHNYPLTSDLTGLTPEQQPKEKEAKMAKQTRKHGAAAKEAAAPARPINPKTGCKEGSVGDKVGLAILAYKTEEKQLEAVKEVIKESFKAKGKSTAEDAVERQAKSWIPYLRKLHPNVYPEAEKVTAKAAPKKSAKKETAAA